MNEGGITPDKWKNEEDASANVQYFSTWPWYIQQNCLTFIWENRYVKPLELLLTHVPRSNFHCSLTYSSLMSGKFIYSDGESPRITAMRRLVIARNTTEENTNYLKYLLQYHAVDPPGHGWRMSQERNALLLEAGALWPWKEFPKGCKEIHRLNASKERATTLLHGLKELIPKDLISQIVTEIYDNRMEKKK